MTPKATKTRKNILDSAAYLFARKGFYNTTVENICRFTNISVGAAYRYFKTKQDILTAISQDILKSLKYKLKIIHTTNSLNETLTTISTIIFSELKKNKYYIKALKEFEHDRNSATAKFYTEIEKEVFKKLKIFIEDSKSNQIVSWLSISMPVFLVSEDEIFEDLNITDNEFGDIFTKIFTEGLIKEKIDENYFKVKNRNIDLKTNNNLSELLKKAEEIFGKCGYEEAKIYEITRNTGCAVGSFYIQFKSKFQAYTKLVESLRDELINTAYNYAFGSKTRGEVETKAFLALFDFAQKHPYGYRIIAESKFVDKNLYFSYYKYIYENYKKQLSFKQNIKSFTINKPEIITAIMMSLGHSVALKKIIWKDIEISEKELIKVVLNGINSIKEEKCLK